MKTGFRGTFVLPWSDVVIDGAPGAEPFELAVGASWAWRGEPVRIDGPGDVLVLGMTAEAAELHRRAARALQRRLGRAAEAVRAGDVHSFDDPVADRWFCVTDGRTRWPVALVGREGRGPLCVFHDAFPPAERELWVSHVIGGAAPPRPDAPEAERAMICFTPETAIATPDGPRLARDLAEGDLVQTKDDGPQVIRWLGRRRLSGARLHAMPRLRPVRIRAGAMGLGQPDAALVLSPDHRVVVRGAMAQALFHEPEVLVAARDLINDRTILIDRQLAEVTYVHLLLDRHSILFANGLEAESFHPAAMDLGAMHPAQRAALAERVPGIERDATVYGGYARRMLTTPEAAILRHALRH